jgi:hypothetical protein
MMTRDAGRFIEPSCGLMHRLAVLIISLVAIVLDNTVLNVALKTILEPKVGLGPP